MPSGVIPRPSHRDYTKFWNHMVQTKFARFEAVNRAENNAGLNASAGGNGMTVTKYMVTYLKKGYSLYGDAKAAILKAAKHH